MSRLVRIVSYSMPLLSPHATTALNAAYAAAEIHRAWFGRLARIEYKGRNDPVTVADREAEAAIAGILREAFPEHALLGEETGQQGEGPYTWLIDPLDGTYNYAHSIPWFAVSIALEHGGRPIVGVCIYLIGSPWASKRKAHFIHSHRSASAAMVHKAQTRKPISAPSMSDARGIEIETGKPRRRR